MQVPFRRPAGALLGLALLAVPAPGKAASPPAAAASDVWLDSTSARWNEVSEKIWGFSETALQETKSSALLADVLEKEGFSVTRGVAGMPTAFVASAGSRGARRRDPRRIRRAAGTLAGGGRAEKDAARRRSARPRVRPQPPRHGGGRGRRRREPRPRRREASRHDPRLRHAGRGAAPRQALHAEGRRLCGNRRRPRLAPRGRELRVHEALSRDHGGRRGILRKDGARRHEPVARAERARRRRGLRPCPRAHAGARSPDGAPPSRDQERRPRGEHHPGLRARPVVRARRERRARERDDRAPEEGRRGRGPRDGDDLEGQPSRLDARAALQRASSRRSFRSISFASARPHGTPPTSRSRAAFRRRSASPRPASPRRFSPMVPATGPGPRPTWER